MLEHSWCVGSPLRADLILELTLPASERCLPLVSFLDSDLMVGVAKVDLREELGAVEAVEHLRYEGEGVAALDSDFVKAPVVHH